MIAEVTLEKGVSRTSVFIVFKNKLPTPHKQSGSLHYRELYPLLQVLCGRSVH